MSAATCRLRRRGGEQHNIVTVIAQNVLLWPVRRRKDALSTRQLRYQLHSVQGRAKYPTDAASVPRRRKLVTGTCAVGQGPKSCNPPG